MAFTIVGQPQIRTSYTGNMKPAYIAKFECDNVSDLPNQEQADYYVELGSTAHVVADNSTWNIKSDGTWVLQQVEGYYTSTQIDSMFASITGNVFGNNPDYQLSDGDDLNTILLSGNYTAGSTSIAGGVANSPWTTTRYKFVNMVITGSAATNLRAVQFIFPNLYANEASPFFFMRYRHNNTFTVWTKIEGTPVV